MDSSTDRTGSRGDAVNRDKTAVSSVTTEKGSSIYYCMPWDDMCLRAVDCREEEMAVQKGSEECVTLRYCVEGRYEIPDRTNRFHYLSPGSLYIGFCAPLGVRHYPLGYLRGVECTFPLSRLEGDVLSDLAAYGDFISWLRRLMVMEGGYFTGEVSDETGKLFSSLYDALVRGTYSIEEYRFFLLQILFILSHGALRDTGRGCTLGGEQRAVAFDAHRKLTEDISVHRSIADLAAGYGISPSSLKQYFEKVYGQPISHFMRAMRMERAKELLVETDLKVGQIAALCGYVHQGKFGRVFFEQTGMNPLQFRRSCLKNRQDS